MIGVEFGFVVEEILVGGGALHGEEDDAFGASREVRGFGGEGVFGGVGLGGWFGSELGGEALEGEPAEACGEALEGGASGDGEREGWRVHREKGGGGGGGGDYLR